MPYILQAVLAALLVLGVTVTTTHIVDKSPALVPWGCKMFEQKLLRLNAKRSVSI
jgi:hypothetical protein